MKAFLAVCVLFVAAGAAKAKRIVGGQDTTIENYPWIVQLDTYNTWSMTWSQGCAANILTATYVLSAAHCFESGQAHAPHRRIRAGSTYRNTGGVVHYISTVLNHPEYRVASRFDGDITLVKLSTPLIFTSKIQRGTIIVQDGYIPDGLRVVHAGWGTTTWGGVAARILQDVEVNVINNELCASRYLQLDRNSIVTKNMICVGLLDVGGRDACQGDSGGPLYYEELIIGIVSWGHRCANDTFPGVNTAVASYTNWIVANAV
ncbi:trypsin CFT-1-like [Leptidea sinapis]|uniref:trypsin CFT-1-like n=1 Tax=Leptidea sinapis TaxID=189913 RepID=UPI002138248E|nr:trypsin CFT-1-like [Leptidea sinapis]